MKLEAEVLVLACCVNLLIPSKRLLMEEQLSLVKEQLNRERKVMSPMQ